MLKLSKQNDKKMLDHAFQLTRKLAFMLQICLDLYDQYLSGLEKHTLISGQKISNIKIFISLSLRGLSMEGEGCSHAITCLI